MELKGSTILITGGTAGLGLEFAKQFLAIGATVIVTGRDKARLQQVKNDMPQIHAFQSDVSNPESIRQLCSQATLQFPALNILINNAGEMRKINLQDTIGLEDITREIEVNLMGPIRMVQQLLPHLKAQQSAAILNVTSGLALVPFPVSPVYGATKSGLRSYTQSLRAQLQFTGIKVFEVLPPAAKTTLIEKFTGDGGMDAKMLMAPEKVVAQAIAGMAADKYEIYPGMARIFRIVSRLAPKFLLKQMAKTGQSEWRK